MTVGFDEVHRSGNPGGSGRGILFKRGVHGIQRVRVERGGQCVATRNEVILRDPVRVQVAQRVIAEEAGVVGPDAPVGGSFGLVDDT